MLEQQQDSANHAHSNEEERKICIRCGKEIPPSRKRAVKFCSPECGWGLRDDRRTSEGRKNRKTKCEWCGSDIPATKRKDAVTCSTKCNLERKEQRRKDAALTNSRTDCKRCGGKIPEPGRSRDYCSNKCRNDVKCEYNSEYRKENPHVVLNGGHRYRARKRGATVEDVDVREVYDRGDWICHICGDHINVAAKWPEPLSASVDHVIPLSKGGAHSYENCKPSHLVCNMRKNDKM